MHTKINRHRVPNRAGNAYRYTLSRMEEKKLIIRQTKDGNKRSLYVYLTDEGKRLQEIVNDTFEKVENEILGGISESEKEQFINTFFKICNNMTNTEELQ